jgi:hypothetical protein
MYLQDKTKEYYPDMITFETNKLTKKEKVAHVIALYNQLGYVVKNRTNDNTILVKEVV